MRRVGPAVRVILGSLMLACVLGAACTRERSQEASSPPPERDAGIALATADAAPKNARVEIPPEAPPKCDEAAEVRIFTSPAVPSTKEPLRIIAVSERPIGGELSVSIDDANATKSDARHGGPPFYWTIEVPSPKAGKWSASLRQPACEGDQGKTAIVVNVQPNAPRAPEAPANGLWPVKAAWSRAYENLYSAWIEILFDAPDGEYPSWPALHEVIRDRKRNFLFDHLGAAEDSAANAPVIRPDCADLPYFLRAYFAFKMRLPFGLGECTRGGGGFPPSCKGLSTNEDPDARADAKKKDGAVATFGAYLRGTLADRAHSGSARTPFEDEGSDYYPIPLTWESLRPGTVYADPYGHVLVVAKRVPQNNERGGVLYAVDGQPDGTIARKRFWRGNFLYATQRELGGPGFKRFRPLVRQGGHLARLDDEGIKRSPHYGDLSREAAKLDLEGFYDAMDDVLAPHPLDPERAMMETISALDEQVKTRVKSVDNGRKWLEKGQGQTPMPEGAEIFETTGAWEDFSTPSRDLRLLIAIDVVRNFPARVARRPDRYAMPPGRPVADVKADLEKVLASELQKRSVTYTRSDGSPFTLTLAEVLARTDLLEMAYNPNECVELRWGAKPGSEEASTCRAHAPAEQKARMETYRTWFHERRRPPRK